MSSLTWNEWLLLLLGFIMAINVIMAVILSLEYDKNGFAVICAIMALMCFVLLASAKKKADSEYDLKHALEHQAVQEGVRSMQIF